MRVLARFFAVFFVFVAAIFANAQHASALVRVNVDLSTQTMRVTSDAGDSHTWKISSARQGYATPRGVYRPQRLEKMHYSRKYDMSPMPHSIFFKGGYAIHGTGAVNALGRPASHGCVRLAKANAAQLYAMVQKEGAVIAITGVSPASTMLASKAKTGKTQLAAQKRQQPAQWAGRTLPTTPMGFAPAPAAPSAKSWAQSPAAWWLAR